MIIIKDGVTEYITAFCNSIGFSDSEIIDKFSGEFGNDPKHFDKLIYFEGKLPFKNIKNLVDYNGDFPSSLTILNSTLDNAALFEIAPTEFLNDIENLPSWLKINNEINLVDVFHDYLSKNLLKEASLVLNRKGWLLINGENSSLMIGGGNNSYVCTFMVGDNEQYFNLINVKNNSNDDVEVVTGGQEGFFEQKIVVDFPLALEAMQYYLLNDEMSPHLIWEED